jgi:hypothetical protein
VCICTCTVIRTSEHHASIVEKAVEPCNLEVLTVLSRLVGAGSKATIKTTSLKESAGSARGTKQNRRDAIIQLMAKPAAACRLPLRSVLLSLTG